jgi:CRISPR-associated protein Cas1
MLIVESQGAALHRHDGLLQVRCPDGSSRTLRIGQVDCAVLFGSVHLTPAARSLFMRAGVPVVFATRDGRVKGALRPDADGMPLMRLGQWRCHHDAGRRRDLVRMLVRAKIDSQHRFARRAARTGGVENGREACSRLRTLREKAAETTDVNALRGVEGYATRLHYEHVAGRLPEWSGFSGRRYHPSPDPANALMSLSYAVLRGELNCYLLATGFDPYVGFVHEVNARRPGLLYDVLEPFRAPLDGFVCTSLNRGQFRASDFQPHEDGGVRLGKEPRGRFFSALLEWLGPREDTEEGEDRSLRGDGRRFCERVASAVRGKGGEAHE